MQKEYNRIYKIDVDGVLRDIIPTMCSIYNDEFGTDITPRDVTDYDVNKIFTKVKDASKYFFVDHAKEVFLDCPSCRGAREALRILHSNGNKIIVCTWQFTDENKKYTIDFLRKNHLVYDDICFTHDKHLIHSDVIVDDNPQFILHEQEQSSERVLISYPYNEYVECEKSGIKCYNSLFGYVTND